MKCRLVEINESKAIFISIFMLKNGFSLVKKVLRRLQNAPYISKFSGGGACPLTLLHNFESTFFIG